MKVKIPTAFRVHTDGERDFEFATGDDTTVGDLFSAIVDRYPNLREQLLDDDGELLSFVNVFVNSENTRDLDGNQTRLQERDEVFLVPAMAGG